MKGMIMTSDSMPACIVIDTNVWISSSLLRIPLGATLIHYTLQNQAFLGLPEVVEKEIHKHAIRIGKEAVDKIKEGFDKLELLMGWRDNYHIPAEEELSRNAEHRLQELEDILIRVPLSFEQMKNALEMLLNEQPPNTSKNQQFKDSLIWQAVLELSRKYTVVFITQDKGFFEERDPRKGLAKSLQQDLLAKNLNITVHYELQSYLDTIKDAIALIDNEKIINRLEETIRDDLQQIASKHRFDLLNIRSHESSTYLTEKTGVIAVNYNITFNATENSYSEEDEEDKKRPALLYVEGSCYYNIQTHEVTEVSHTSVRLADIQGNVIPGKSIHYLYAKGIVSSSRESVRYNFKKEI